MAQLRSAALGDTRTKKWIGVDIRLKPVLIPTDVIKNAQQYVLQIDDDRTGSTLGQRQPQPARLAREIPEPLPGVPKSAVGYLRLAVRDGSMNPASKQRKKEDIIHQDEGPRSTGMFGVKESVKGRKRE
ncbi:unnamed protein product [Nippostrongylus brasiliensis]|uniref:Uncharacterized protein n=1 Tax=Nippostrongylus brasiliensis TaxID=27835 RepID=A0A0N4YQW9_NIPBR|nr:unnamed protein product [Nippostrongylus brasiliensis]